jgi:predicted GIY-YIG superfamily endonuclease
MLLFADPRPLVERLGRDFFRQVPERPGVYLMRDEGGTVLYVGKARNLRKRLGTYRVANPDRMPRRHLRMLRSVASIELQECADESSALARESELLRSLKPRFNRAGTWPGSPRWFAWRRVGENLELSVTETPEAGWRTFGPLGRSAVILRSLLVRLLWTAIHPEQGFVGLPAGWALGRLEDRASIHSGPKTDEAIAFVEKLFAGQVDTFSEWVSTQLRADSCPFERTAVAEDLDALKTMMAPGPSPSAANAAA